MPTITSMLVINENPDVQDAGKHHLLYQEVLYR